MGNSVIDNVSFIWVIRQCVVIHIFFSLSFVRCLVCFYAYFSRHSYYQSTDSVSSWTWNFLRFIETKTPEIFLLSHLHIFCVCYASSHKDHAILWQSTIHCILRIYTHTQLQTHIIMQNHTHFYFLKSTKHAHICRTKAKVKKEISRIKRQNMYQICLMFNEMKKKMYAKE